MRTFLNGMYRLFGAIAGGFVALIAVLVVVQIVGRLFGLLVPGAFEIAGFSLTFATYFALAYTLRAGEHIRITVVLGRLSPQHRRPFELWSLAVGAFFAGYLAYYAGDMTWEAFKFGDMSVGTLGIPMSIPMGGMTLGSAVLFISFIDEFIKVLRGQEPTYHARSGAILEHESAGSPESDDEQSDKL